MSDSGQPKPHRPGDYTRKRGGKRTTWTPEVQAAFLLALRRHGSMTAAAGSVGVHEGLARYHRDHDEEFALECDNAIAALDEELMAVVKEHATKGVVVREIRNDAGEVVVRERKYSEKLLLAWLRRQESGSWRDRGSVDVNHTGAVQHQHTGRIEVEQLTPEQRHKARDFLASLN